ncbi:hypothetical protein B0J17DRAFT_766598 [Rhizoctonia solani]|nr:hypothetical protein B0J17DRAFT_766598 [Rhizoctonia solani]
MRTSFKQLLGGLSLLAIQITSVRSHAVIIAVAGDNGVTGAGFGMVSSVPRDGTDEQPFQIDTSVFKNLIADPCGSTLAGGSVNIAKSLAAAEKAGNGQLPALTDDMVISMTLHQVNGDGGGPFNAMFNVDGTGRKWQNATVVTQAPGENGLLAGGPFNSLFEAQLPTGTKCTGGANGNACLIRVSNGGAAVGAGPFGGCLAVQMPSGNGGNSTTGNGNNNTGGNRNGRNRNNSQKLQRSNDISQLKRQIQRLVRRLSISPSEANDLITAAGSALNVPIDLLAGQDDASPNGGNSTTAKNAVLSVNQAEQLKVAVKDAVSKAIEMMATGGVTPTAGAVATPVNSNPDLAISRNQEMTASFSSGLATFVSEPVGQPAGTAIATATATATGRTGRTGATRTTAAATATSTSTRGNGNGRNHNGNNNNGNNDANRNQNQNQNNRNSANESDMDRRGGNNKRGVRRPRMRSRVMRDIVFDEQW